MSTTTECKTCRKPKANLHCHLCQDAICKKCTQFVDEGRFAYMRSKPVELTHTNYCINCWDEKIADHAAAYDATLEKAKEVILLFKNQGKLTRFIKRKEDPYHVDHCADKDEAMLNLAFYAAEDGFNALIDVDVNAKKVNVGTYLKHEWGGSAVPTTMDPDSINPDAFRGV